MKLPKGTEGGTVYSHFLLLHWSETFVELNQDNTNSATINLFFKKTMKYKKLIEIPPYYIDSLVYTIQARSTTNGEMRREIQNPQILFPRNHLYFSMTFVFFLLQDEATETLLELKQKEYTNILFELPKGIDVATFFRLTAKIGLSGEGVHFVLVSLDFQARILPPGVREVDKDSGNDFTTPLTTPQRGNY
jgi:hypothetical protein